MATWQVEITGHRFDLEELPVWFTDRDFRVVEDAGAFFLEAAELEAFDASADVHAAARPLVKLINGIAKLKSSSFRGVELGAGVRELDAEGQQRRHVVLAVGTVEARAKVNAVLVKVGDTEPEPTAPGPCKQMHGSGRQVPTPKRGKPSSFGRALTTGWTCTRSSRSSVAARTSRRQAGPRARS